MPILAEIMIDSGDAEVAPERDRDVGMNPIVLTPSHSVPEMVLQAVSLPIGL